MAFVDVFFFLTSQLILVTIGSQVVSRLLLKDYKPPGLLQFTNPLYHPHLIFSLTLGASSSLFLLVFGEIINVFSKGARWQYWQFNLILLLVLVIIVIPWYQVYTFLYHTKRWRRKTAIYATTVIWAVYLYLFNKTTLLSTATSGELHTTKYGWLELGIFRVSVLGITLTSILSGFGVVNSPFMTWTVYTQHVSESEYTVAQQAYDNTISTIQEKRSTLDRLRQVELQGSASHEKPSSFVNQLLSSIVGDSNQKESKLLEVEIQQLEHLSVNMKSDLDELGRGRLRSQLSRTWRGKLQNGIDLLFSVYCVYRLATTTLNVITQRNGTGDPITNTLSLIIGRFGITTLPMDTKFWSQQLSFWFAGMIVFGSVRGALKLLTKILRNFTLHFTISTRNIILFIAHMLGMYFLSSVLMMQVSLPPDYRYLISSTLEHTEFTFFQRWSDIILVLSSLITAAILYVLHQTNDAKNLATDYADMQLSSIESGGRRRLD